MKNKEPLHLTARRLEIWNIFSGQINLASDMDIFLDYDGTITPIRKTPSEAFLAPDSIQLLQKLIQLPHLRVAIVTGRSLEDIRRLVPFENIRFIANHGFHIYQSGNEWIHSDAVLFQPILHNLYHVLQSALESIPNVFVENKQFTLSIHYRNASPKDKTSVKPIAEKSISSFDSRLIITEGKEILEVRPPVDWGKGHAVVKTLNTPQYSTRSLQIYIGDDITDESAFRALRSSGITIHVGETLETCAQYYVTDVDEVFQILKLIIKLQTPYLKSRSDE